MQNKDLQSHTGYLLIELMVAMTVFTIGFLAVMGLTAHAVSTTRVITDSFTANYLAVEGIEIIKSFLDENALRPGPWNQGFNNEQCYVLDYTGSRTTAGPCPAVMSDVFSVASAQLQFDSTTGFYVRTGAFAFSPFYRIVRVTPEAFGSPRYLKLESVVAWFGRGGTRNEVVLEDYLFDQK